MITARAAIAAVNHSDRTTAPIPKVRRGGTGTPGPKPGGGTYPGGAVGAEAACCGQPGAPGAAPVAGGKDAGGAA